MYIPSHKRESRTKRFVRLILLIVIVVVTGIVVKNMTWKHSIVSPVANSKQTSKQTVLSVSSKNKDPDELKKSVKTLIGNQWKNYSILISDFNSDFSAGINETEIFAAASVNKVPILASLYEEVSKKPEILDRQVTPQQSDIQDYGTGSIRYDPPGTGYSVKTLARLMMQQSDNTAAYILANHIVGQDTIQEYVNSWGMTQTDIATNKTSNKDMAILFKKIAHSEVSRAPFNEEMMSFLKDSDFEDRLPALLPKTVTVYHKIGTAEGGIHDVGYVSGDRVKYYIGVMTTDIGSEEKTIKLLANLSKLIYDFMSK